MHLFTVGLLSIVLSATPIALASATPALAYTPVTDQDPRLPTADQRRNASQYALDSGRLGISGVSSLHILEEDDVVESSPLGDGPTLGYEGNHGAGELSIDDEGSSSDDEGGRGAILATLPPLKPIMPLSLAPVVPRQPSLYSPTHRKLMESGISHKMYGLFKKLHDQSVPRQYNDILEWYMQQHAGKIFQLIADDMGQFYDLSRSRQPLYDTSLTPYDTTLNHPVLLGLAKNVDADYATVFMIKLTRMQQWNTGPSVYLEATPRRWAPMTADFVSTLVLHHQIPAALEYLDHMQDLGMDTDELLVTRAYWLYLDRAYEHAQTLLNEVSCEDLVQRPDIEALCIPLKVMFGQHHESLDFAEDVPQLLDDAVLNLTPVGLGFGSHLTELPTKRDNLIFVSVPRAN